MNTMYVDLSGTTPKICSQLTLQRNHSRYKNAPFTVLELADIPAALLNETAVGDVPTGGAVLAGGVYYREYRPFTSQELSDRALAALAATDAGMPRSVEDLIDTLDRLGIMAKTELPQSTQDRHADKKAKRAAL